jgi:hypothetical protein
MTAAQELKQNSIDWDVPLLRPNSFVPLKSVFGPILVNRTVSRCSPDAEHPACSPTLAVDRDWLTKSDLPKSSRATA